MSMTTKSITVIIYVVISCLLINEMSSAQGGSGLGAYLILLIFQSVFASASILYLIFSRDYKSRNSIQRVEYIILAIIILAPIITFVSVST